MQILIKKAIVLCKESTFHKRKKDLLIKDGIIVKIADNIKEKADITIEDKDLHVSLSWVDMMADFCEPGFEHKETLSTGAQSALSGGFSHVCILPHTNPTLSNKSQIESVVKRKLPIQILPIGSVSKNIEGKELAEMFDMKNSGAIAFSDGRNAIQNSALMLKALQYVKAFDGIIIQIPEDKAITSHGLMHEGMVSTQLGMQGKPDIAETMMIHRDIELTNYTKSRVHFASISSAKSVSLIKQAKAKNSNISCSTSLAHLLFTDQALTSYDSLYKLTPPLRTETDRKALIKGIKDNTIDCIATHHTPQDWDAKTVEFEYAKEGMIGLQPFLPAILRIKDELELEDWIELVSSNPRRLLKLPMPEIKEKQQAQLTVFSTTKKWSYNQSSNASKSNNSPFFDQTLSGKVLAVINHKDCFINE